MYKKVLNFASKYSWLNSILTITCSILSLFFDYELLKAYSFWQIFIILLIIICITFISLSSYHDRNIPKLEEELKIANEKLKIIREQIKDLFDFYLSGIAKDKLLFDEYNSEERVTLYLHNGKSAFIPVSRFSFNPKYDTIGRLTYPDCEGYISKAWDKGQFFTNSIENNKFKMSKKTINSIRMKSKLFAIIRIEKLGLIVVESTNKDKYKEDEINNILDREKRYLSDMLYNFKEYIPDNYAGGKGI